MGSSNTIPDKMKNILIIDDINDTGATFEWLVNDWKQSVYSIVPYGIKYLVIM